ncbi:peptidoglycan bridge formation glycyltransferase FemA/FemB family protein [Candidatus Saccharibacteria bacterium]|nr:peptidoglycan bridge formation glycyltransferase FemA/FemB family protein [Candidatus Saccharibacteria bacterium]
MRVPITQSEEWRKLQDNLGETNFFKTGNGYQFLAILKKTPVGNYLYCPYGPAAKDQKSFQEAIEALQSLGREQSAIFIRVEPFRASEAEYLPHTAIKSKDLNPKETWLLDLTGTDDDLRSKLPSRLLRYYKSASKKGITIETSHDPADIHYLLDLQKALAKEKGISTFSEHYLQTELKQPFATLYLIKYDKEVVAAGLVFDDKTTRYNLQGAQSDEGRKLHATGILTIQLILDAKSAGKQIFDFWGIAPEGSPSAHPWAGFTNFKKTFAGYQYDHAGTYDLILKPAKYKLYKTTRRLHRLLRK